MESRKKTLAESPSSLQEPSKTEDPHAKAVKNSSKTRSAKNRGVNRAGVSINGREGFGDDLGGGYADKTKVSISEEVGDAKDDSFGDIDGGLEDSEINGVSSLLKMQQGESLKELSSAVDFIDMKEKRGSGCDDGDIRGDVPTLGVKESRDVGDGVTVVESLDANEGYPDEKTGELSGSKGVQEEEDMEGCEFSVGDFVWGKIKSHPWWPGRIYDPLDASDFAKKVKQRERILVAYFGDGTFAWCIPTQLRPFQENFADMSKQSSSKNFINAVEEAVNEVGRLVDLKMTCSCVPKDNLIGFGRSLAVNAGIKEGLLVPEGGIEKFSKTLFEPAEFLPALKGIAQVDAIPNMLEFGVLKNWLSAFYRSKGGHQLPTYYEPLPIPGLEDDTRNGTVDLSNCNRGGEVTIQGPIEEDWFSSPVGPKHDQTTQRSLQKCQGISDGRQYHRRKQKSIAEILGDHNDAEAENKEDDVAKGKKSSSKLASSAERKNRKGRGKIMGREMDAEHKNEVSVAKGGADSGSSASSAGRKKREDIDAANVEGKHNLGYVSEAGTNSTNPASSVGRKKRKDSDAADSEGKNKLAGMSKAETNVAKSASSAGRKKRKVSDEVDGNVAIAGANPDKPASSSRRKKGQVSDEDKIIGGSNSISKRRQGAKLSESLLEAENKLSILEVDGSRVKRESKKIPLSKDRKKRSSGVENDKSVALKEEMGDDTVSAEKKMDGVGSPRERKKSKYLSPPYTNLNQGQSKKEIEAESQRISYEAQIGEQINMAASLRTVSSPILKSSGEGSQKKPHKEPGSGHQASDSKGPQTPKQDQNNIIDPLKAKAPAKEILCHFRSAARNVMYLSESETLDVVEGFFSAFRSSIYCDGSNYKIYNKFQSGRKRKSEQCEPEPFVNEQNETDHSSSGHKSKPRKIKKIFEGESDKPKVKQAATTPDMKTNDKESGRKAPAAALFVKFGPGSSMPSKNDLIKMYGKFGALNKEETENFPNNHCAKIVFLKSCDAEEAFNDSQLTSPFGVASVTFQLQYLSAETKTCKLGEISGSKHSSPAKEGEKTPNKRSASQSSASDVSELKYIRQKLEMMTSMLGTSDGKMSADVKTKLESEMKGLLEKVNTMVGPSSS